MSAPQPADTGTDWTLCVGVAVVFLATFFIQICLHALLMSDFGDLITEDDEDTASTAPVVAAQEPVPPVCHHAPITPLCGDLRSFRLNREGAQADWLSLWETARDKSEALLRSRLAMIGQMHFTPTAIGAQVAQTSRPIPVHRRMPRHTTHIVAPDQEM